LNPERVVFTPELVAHASNPQAGFSGQRLKKLADWMKAQRR
jgi:hypothetical protein